MSKIVWLTGISGAGKTTLANSLFEEFKKRQLPVTILDGDKVRDFFEGDLGYSRQERIMNVRRIAFTAHELCQNGVNVIVANIAPYYEVRDFIRRKLSANYIQIYLKVSLDEVTRRDVKGLYKQFNTGNLENIIGADDGYDVPRNPDLVIQTGNEDAQTSLKKIIDFIFP